MHFDMIEAYLSPNDKKSHCTWKKYRATVEDNYIMLVPLDDSSNNAKIMLSLCLTAEKRLRNLNNEFMILFPAVTWCFRCDCRSSMIRLINLINSKNSGHCWFISDVKSICSLCHGHIEVNKFYYTLHCPICQQHMHHYCALKNEIDCKWNLKNNIKWNKKAEAIQWFPHQFVKTCGESDFDCYKCHNIKKPLLKCLWCSQQKHLTCEIRQNICYGNRLSSITISPLIIEQIGDTAEYKIDKKYIHIVPFLFFINVRSGNYESNNFFWHVKHMLNPLQVYDPVVDGFEKAFSIFSKFDKFIVIVCGGDGTYSSVFTQIHRFDLIDKCKIIVLPFGTGNDMSSVLGWKNRLDSVDSILKEVKNSSNDYFDNWSVKIAPDSGKDDGYFNWGSQSGENKIKSNLCENEYTLCNYFGIGIDAQIALNFHNKRQKCPNSFNKRIKNLWWYFIFGAKQLLLLDSPDINKYIELECDGVNIPLPKIKGITFLNINSYMGGVDFWGTSKGKFLIPSYNDGLIEVVVIYSVSHMASARFISFESHRIAQCQTAVIRFKKNEILPIQIDGEPWTIDSSTITISTRPKKFNVMVQKKKFKSIRQFMTSKKFSKDEFFYSSIYQLQLFTGQLCDFLMSFKEFVTSEERISNTLKDLMFYSSLFTLSFQGGIDRIDYLKMMIIFWDFSYLVEEIFETNKDCKLVNHRKIYYAIRQIASDLTFSEIIYYTLPINRDRRNFDTTKSLFGKYNIANMTIELTCLMLDKMELSFLKHLFENDSIFGRNLLHLDEYKIDNNYRTKLRIEIAMTFFD